jgi:hypothetical protein
MAGFISYGSMAQTSTNELITIKNFKVYEKDAKQVVEWSTGAINTNYWQVQCSTDGATFTTIALVLGDDPKQPGTYRYAEKIKQGMGLQKYYRLCHIGMGGAQQMSEIIQPAK